MLVLPAAPLTARPFFLKHGKQWLVAWSWTRLHATTKHGSPVCVADLLSAGADIDHADQEGSVPATAGVSIVAEILLNNGANVSTESMIEVICPLRFSSRRTPGGDKAAGRRRSRPGTGISR